MHRVPTETIEPLRQVTAHASKTRHSIVGLLGCGAGFSRKTPPARFAAFLHKAEASSAGAHRDFSTQLLYFALNKPQTRMRHHAEER